MKKYLIILGVIVIIVFSFVLFKQDNEYKKLINEDMPYDITSAIQENGELIYEFSVYDDPAYVQEKLILLNLKVTLEHLKTQYANLIKKNIDYITIKFYTSNHDIIMEVGVKVDTLHNENWHEINVGSVPEHVDYIQLFL
ncbi:hypothetical protein ACERII_13965 [Evansella sp. AB-rgal1]|uniref:hypothetical protein n=1 Tax=Evansella sp. AB-rgal1 TaxID=3242696 RepID=UPI00359DBC80